MTLVLRMCFEQPRKSKGSLQGLIGECRSLHKSSLGVEVSALAARDFAAARGPGLAGDACCSLPDA